MGSRRILFMLLLGAGLLLAGGWFACSHTYRGMSQGVANQFRHARAGETVNLLRCIRYWLHMMGRLEPDPATGRYGFPPAHAFGEADLDRCLVAYHRGEFAPAAACFQRQIAAGGRSEERLFWLAMTQLRLAESENCLPAQQSGSDLQGVCTLPVERFHEHGHFSRRAAALFTELLDRYSEEDRLYRWLLNFSYMTVGGFPGEVPERYLIDGLFVDSFYGAGRSRAVARHPHLRFTDRARELGVDTMDTGRGVAVEDFDRDGWLDLVTGGSFDTVRYYANQQGRHFVDRTVEAGLGGIDQPFVITAADYDNDGWIDLFVGRPFDEYRLLRNRGEARFEDVTAPSGLLDAKAPDEIAATWVSAWGDIDNDGDLDLFVAQWAFRLPFVRGLMARPRMDSKLFVNEGGRFSDATRELGLGPLTADQYFIGAAFADFDGDGFADLYLSSPLPGTSLLLRNQGGAGFRRVALKNHAAPGFTAAFVDVDHDGRLDLFQAGFSDARSSTEQSVFGENRGSYASGPSVILLQDSEGRFVVRPDLLSSDFPMATMGASYGDLDNDGCHDFYLGTGNPESWFVLPNLMYLGLRDGRRCTGAVENISMLQGFGTIQKGHGIVFFDFNNNGAQDVYSSLGGMWPGDRWPNQLFVNESDLKRSWIKVRLRGRETNYYGVGAKLRVVAAAADGDEIVRHHHMDNKTGFGSAPYLAHIGLLDAVEVRFVEVYWPVSGCTQRIPGHRIALDRLHVFDEKDCLEEGARSGG